MTSDIGRVNSWLRHVILTDLGSDAFTLFHASVICQVPAENHINDAAASAGQVWQLQMQQRYTSYVMFTECD